MAPTEDVERLTGETHGADSLFVRIVAAIGLVLMFRPLTLIRNRDVLGGNETLFTIEIPRCATCRKGGPLTRLHVDLERQQVLVQVRRAFKERMEQPT